jgi:Na+-translocating ferredoxin:NAD+ oxidoreductase RnfE subunit
MNIKPYTRLLIDGLVLKNPLFITGLVISPAVFCADSFRGGLTAAICFSLTTAVTAAILALLPVNKLIYTLRIILYTAIAACVCGGALWVTSQIFTAEVSEFLVFLPCMCVKSLILERFDKRNTDTKRKKLFFTVSAVIGFDVAILIFAAVREILSYGTLADNTVSFNLPIPVFGYVFGGFILLGLFCGLFRLILKAFGITVESARDNSDHSIKAASTPIETAVSE